MDQQTPQQPRPAISVVIEELSFKVMVLQLAVGVALLFLATEKATGFSFILAACFIRLTSMGAVRVIRLIEQRKN